MAGEWDADLYGEWDDSHQELFDSLADSFGSDAVYDDDILQAYVDVLFGDERIAGDDWHAIHDALIEYVWDVYDFDFDAEWDWEAWRELYG